MTVNFVSYDGKYPNLCSGNLILEVDGKLFKFERHSLCSGGSVTFNDNWEERVSSGPYTVDEFPEGFPEEAKAEALEVINNNVPHGCCGGCV